MLRACMKAYTEVTAYVPWLGEFMIHLELPGFTPVRMYCWTDELATRSRDLEWVEEDEQDLCNPKRWRKGKNPLFSHARGPGMVRRHYDLLQEFIGEEL